MSNHGLDQRASRLGKAIAIVLGILVIAAVPGEARAGDAEDIRNAITGASEVGSEQQVQRNHLDRLAQGHALR